jgi:hypothetical protein
MRVRRRDVAVRVADVPAGETVVLLGTMRADGTMEMSTAHPNTGFWTPVSVCVPGDVWVCPLPPEDDLPLQ